MTAAVLDRPGSLFADAAERPTLEELLSSALREARTNGSTECPVCHARMTSSRAPTRAREAALAEAPHAGEDFAAECGGCGSRLG